MKDPNSTLVVNYDNDFTEVRVDSALSVTSTITRHNVVTGEISVGEVLRARRSTWVTKAILHLQHKTGHCGSLTLMEATLSECSRSLQQDRLLLLCG